MRGRSTGHLIRFIAILEILIAAVATAQMRPGPGRPEQIAQFLYFEPVTLFSADPAKARVDIHYRIDENFFVAVRNTDTSFPHEFRSQGEILVELTDSAAGAVVRNLERVVIGAEQEEAGEGPTQWHEGMFSFDLKPGTYAVNFDVTDLESHRNFNDRAKRVHVRLPERESLAVSTLLFIRRTTGTGPARQIVPLNYGGDLLFGSPTAICLEVGESGSQDSTVNVRYHIMSISPSRDEPPEVNITDSLRVPGVRNVSLVSRMDGGEIGYTLEPGAPSHTAILIIPFPGDRLPLRSYMMDLTVSQGAAREETHESFRTVWPEMPLPLKDVDYAIDILRYITSPTQLDSLKDGNFETRRKHLEEFWKRRDKTPETPYNEVMTEYYRRVDHAMRSFGTLHTDDGAKSDRGRIYILYGPPTRTKRTLNPTSSFEEIWIYERLNKQFTFVDKNRNGTYELVELTTQ